MPIVDSGVTAGALNMSRTLPVDKAVITKGKISVHAVGKVFVRKNTDPYYIKGNGIYFPQTMKLGSGGKSHADFLKFSDKANIDLIKELFGTGKKLTKSKSPKARKSRKVRKSPKARKSRKVRKSPKARKSRKVRKSR
jgi:hypothetical protein